MDLVAGAVDERDLPQGCAAHEIGQGLRRRAVAQLAAVAHGEFAKARGVVSEPLSQLGAGRDVLEPGIEPQVGLAHAARPEPLDQHPFAVAGGGGLVRAL